MMIATKSLFPSLFCALYKMIPSLRDLGLNKSRNRTDISPLLIFGYDIKEVMSKAGSRMTRSKVKKKNHYKNGYKF